jgi:hypothetical protein
MTVLRKRTSVPVMEAVVMVVLLMKYGEALCTGHAEATVDSERAQRPAAGAICQLQPAR